MATNLSTCHPGDGIEALNRLPGLAEPLLQIDFERELQQLRREDSWQREFKNTCEISRFPNRSDSDEKRYTNAAAQSRGQDLHSAVERASLYTSD